MKLGGRTVVADPEPRVNGAAVAGTALPSARLPLRTRQRRPGYIALAVALVVGLGALGGFFYREAGSKTPVVVLVNEVPAGHTLTRADLTTLDVAGGVTAVAAGNLDSMVGKTSTVTLLPNMLLQRSMVTDGPLLTSDQAQVGVEVTGGQLPAGGLAAGDTVVVLRLPEKANAGSSATPSDPTVLARRATVFDTAASPSDASGTLVTLVVPSDESLRIAAASNDDLVALIRVAP